MYVRDFFGFWNIVIQIDLLICMLDIVYVILNKVKMRFALEGVKG
jgi:hypothetical protein